MLKSRTPSEWYDVLVACHVKPVTAGKWSDSFAREMVGGALSAGESELDDFLGQVLTESSMLEHTEENLFYTTAARVRAVWPSRFATDADAEPYLRDPQRLAGKVYGSRMGNTCPADGWRYRGRGLVMLTGRDNYLLTGRSLGLDLLNDPDQVSNPDVALRIALNWWERTIPDAVLGNLVAVTKRVNGGTTGIGLRGELTDLAARALA